MLPLLLSELPGNLLAEAAPKQHKVIISDNEALNFVRTHPGGTLCQHSDSFLRHPGNVPRQLSQQFPIILEGIPAANG